MEKKNENFLHNLTEITRNRRTKLNRPPDLFLFAIRRRRILCGLVTLIDGSEKRTVPLLIYSRSHFTVQLFYKQIGKHNRKHSDNTNTNGPVKRKNPRTFELFLTLIGHRC